MAILVQDKDQLSPPGGPYTVGHAWLINGVGAGAWAGHDGEIAIATSTAGDWIFIYPTRGWTVFVVDEGIEYTQKNISAPYLWEGGLEPLFKFGTAADHALLSAVRGIELVGATTVWDDERVPLSVARPGAGIRSPGYQQYKTNGAGSQGVYAFHFDPAQEEEVFFSIQLPHGYKEGSSITPHVHWAPKDNTTGTVIWGLEYHWQSMDGVFGNTTIIEVTETLLVGSQDKHIYTAFAPIVGTGQKISSILNCRLYRKAATDTYNADAVCFEFDVHYERNTMGSQEELVK